MSIRIYKGFLINTNFKKAGRFIDLETFIKEEDDQAFAKATVTRLIPFIKIPVKVKAVAIALYMMETSEMKERFTWIYNPPSFPNTGEITQGSIERENFALTYGGYLEMVYLIVTQFGERFDKVLKMDTNQFLFLGEYLLRKRIVEGLK